MGDRSAARTYSRALFAQAASAKSLRICQERLDEAARVAKAVPALVRTMAHPAVSADEKRGILKTLLGPSAPELLEWFLVLLVQKHRFSQLPVIAEEYHDLVDRQEGIEPLKVRSAVALPEEDRRQLQARLEKWLKTKVRLDFQVDPSLIGGWVVQSRDRVLDQSLKGQLAQLQRRLSLN